MKPQGQGQNGRSHADCGKQFDTERVGRIRGSDRKAATSLSKTETEGLPDHTGTQDQSRIHTPGELAVMAHALSALPGLKQYRTSLLSSNKAAALTPRNPRQQSGLEHICQIYKLIRRLRKHENQLNILLVSAREDNHPLGLAKEQARAATHEDAIPQVQVSRVKSTTLNILKLSESFAGSNSKAA